MPKIVKLEEFETIKPGEPPEIAEDGTILNPVVVHLVNVSFDNGTQIQLERPLTEEKIRQALAKEPPRRVDELKEGHKVGRYGIGDIIRLRWWRS